MNKKQIIGLVVAAVVFIAVGVTSVFTNVVSQNLLKDEVSKTLAGGYEFTRPSSDYVAVVKVEGTIQEQTVSNSLLDESVGYKHTTTIDYINDLMEDQSNKGILLYVDSPGGTVYESEELYNKLMEYKEKTSRPIWGYMAHYAASGGYMVSMAADKIYANAGTTTGSIGVIMSGYDMTGLYEKLGIRYVSITSGANKDSSQLSDEQIAIYQTQIDEFYEKFVDIVENGRGMSEDAVKELADGRTYTAQQALDNGLIDEVSSYEDMREIVRSEAGVSTLYELDTTADWLTSIFATAESLVPKSEAQILTETADGIESGVPMYYAEQLQ